MSEGIQMKEHHNQAKLTGTGIEISLVGACLDTDSVRQAADRGRRAGQSSGAAAVSVTTQAADHCQYIP